jgi:6-phosphogluconolactonase
MPWSDTFVLWSDERYVPLHDDRSNAGAAETIMLKNVPVPVKHVFPMYMDGNPPEKAARRYEEIIRGLYPEGQPRLDLVLLGCGTDGHTASLFPGSPLLSGRHSLVGAVQAEQRDVPRITMTPTLLNQARLIVFIVYGESKADAVKRVLSSDAPADELPARIIAPVDGTVRWLLDDEAASQLEE